MIFDVFDVLLAVNMCINYSFLHLYLQFYYSRKFKIFKVGLVTLATPLYWVITNRILLAVAYPTKENEVSSFDHPFKSYRGGSQNFKSRSGVPGHAPLGGHSSPVGYD